MRVDYDRNTRGVFNFGRQNWIDICINISPRALFRLGQWVQLHPSIFRNAYLHPSIIRKTPIVTIIFDNSWVQISFSSHICTHQLKILKRALTGEKNPRILTVNGGMANKFKLLCKLPCLFVLPSVVRDLVFPKYRTKLSWRMTEHGLICRTDAKRPFSSFWSKTVFSSWYPKKSLTVLFL